MNSQTDFIKMILMTRPHKKSRKQKTLFLKQKDPWYVNRTVSFSVKKICITLESIASLITVLASFLLLCP